MSQILYVTKFIGGAGGGGATQSAVDVLIAMLATPHPVTTVSYVRCKVPARVNGQVIRSTNWITPRRPFPKQLNRYFPRRVAGWLRDAARDPGWAARLQQLRPPNLVVVNGTGNDKFLDQIKQLKPNLKGKSAFIIRGSPKEEHFQGTDMSIDWVLKTMGKYDYLIFVSSRCRDDWLSRATFSNKQTFYIPNCCQEDVVAHLVAQDKAQVRQRLKLPSDQFVAVCVASVSHRKGQDLLQKYFNDFLAVMPELVIYLVGPPLSSWSQSLRQQIAASGFADRLQMLGSKSNALDYIYAADLLLLPTRAEALPRTILEAMALKTPVVASDVDGIPELIEHNQSGLLFSHERPEGLVEGFEYMVTNPDMRQVFAEQAHQKYWSNFSRAHQIKRYGEALKIMLN